MRIPNRKYLIGGAVLALLGAGMAEAATAQLHTMKVAGPDGQVVEVQYTGKVAPRVQVLPAQAISQIAYAPDMSDPFVQMQRASAMMDAQMDAMMQRAAMMQQHAAAMQQQIIAASANGRAVPGLTMTGDMPKGMHVTYVSSTTDANGCTRTVSYQSDGGTAAPTLTKASSDGCDAAGSGAEPIQAKASVPAGHGRTGRSESLTPANRPGVGRSCKGGPVRGRLFAFSGELSSFHGLEVADDGLAALCIWHRNDHFRAGHHLHRTL